MASLSQRNSRRVSILQNYENYADNLLQNPNRSNNQHQILEMLLKEQSSKKNSSLVQFEKIRKHSMKLNSMNSPAKEKHKRFYSSRKKPKNLGSRSVINYSRSELENKSTLRSSYENSNSKSKDEEERRNHAKYFQGRTDENFGSTGLLIQDLNNGSPEEAEGQLQMKKQAFIKKSNIVKLKTLESINR